MASAAAALIVGDKRKDNEPISMPDEKTVSMKRARTDGAVDEPSSAVEYGRYLCYSFPSHQTTEDTSSPMPLHQRRFFQTYVSTTARSTLQRWLDDTTGISELRRDDPDWKESRQVVFQYVTSTFRMMQGTMERLSASKSPITVDQMVSEEKRLEAEMEAAHKNAIGKDALGHEWMKYEAKHTRRDAVRMCRGLHTAFDQLSPYPLPRGVVLFEGLKAHRDIAAALYRIGRAETDLRAISEALVGTQYRRHRMTSTSCHPNVAARFAYRGGGCINVIVKHTIVVDRVIRAISVPHWSDSDVDQAMIEFEVLMDGSRGLRLTVKSVTLEQLEIVAMRAPFSAAVADATRLFFVVHVDVDVPL